MTAARMLLVEDDAALAELLTFHFERADFLVPHTPDGAEALLFARETPPDIVLLAWMVEGLSGIEQSRRLGRAPGTGNVRSEGRGVGKECDSMCRRGGCRDREQ